MTPAELSSTEKPKATTEVDGNANAEEEHLLEHRMDGVDTSTAREINGNDKEKEPVALSEPSEVHRSDCCARETMWTHCLFYAIGRLISYNPLFPILIGLALTAMSVGMIKMELKDEIRDGYTPENAPSWEEMHAMQDFWGSKSETLTTLLVVQSKDGNMFQMPQLMEVEALYRYFNQEFQCPNDKETINGTQAHCKADWGIEICGRNCQPKLDGRNKMCGEQCEAMSTLIHSYLISLNQSSEALLKGQSISEALNVNGDVLTYPTAVIHTGFELFPGFGLRVKVPARLELFFFGVTTNTTLINASMTLNDTRGVLPEQLLTNIEHVQLMLVLLRAEEVPDEERDMLAKCQLAIADHFVQNPPKLLHIDVVGTEILNQEMMREGYRTIPYFAAGFAVIFLFVTINIVGTAYCRSRLNLSTCLIVLTLIACPVLAVTTTFGILSVSGLRINSFLLIMPFLCLGIGVDDGFMLVHKWDQTLYITNPRERLCFVLSQVGPSITITTLTNVISFAIGCGMPTPEVRLFCAGAAIALTTVYLLHLLVFCPVLQLTVHLERKCNNKSVSNVQKQQGGAEIPNPDLLIIGKSIMTGTQAEFLLDRTFTGYCTLITKPWFGIVLFLVLLGYWGFSIVGCLCINSFLDPAKILPKDSPLQSATRKLDDVVWATYLPVTVLVQTPFDISDPEQLDIFWRMIDQFVGLPESKGLDFSLIWLKDFELFLRNNEDGVDACEISPNGWNRTRPLDPCKLCEFTEKWCYKHWTSFLRLTKEEGVKCPIVTKFTSVVAYTNMSSWKKREVLVQKLRTIATDHSRPNFKVSIFEQNAMFIDQVLSMMSTVLSTGLFTLCCMAIICAVFTPNPFSVIIGVLAIGSICIGVFGFFYWWGFDLDPIVMAALLMSIGLSVDFCTHVLYYFQFDYMVRPGSSGTFERIRFSSRLEKVKFVLKSIGWPMLQSAISTVMCTLPLALTKSYSANVFVVAIFLVCGLGFLHGVLVLPCLLASLPGFCTSSTVYRNLLDSLRVATTAKSNK